MKKYFFIEESPYHNGYYSLRLDFDKIGFGELKGSANVFPARLLGLQYADYLRFCRDNYNATLFGKGRKYPVPLFKDKSKGNSLCTMLNKEFEKFFEV